MSTRMANFVNEVRRAIKRGEAYLDGRFGEQWDERIDLEKLNLRFSESCVCGQLNISFENYKNPNGGMPWLSHNSDLGFSAHTMKHYFKDKDGEDKLCYEKLTKLWKQRIAARRNLRESLKPLSYVIASANDVVSENIAG